MTLAGDAVTFVYFESHSLCAPEISPEWRLGVSRRSASAVDRTRQRSEERRSLGSLSLPHQRVRIVVAEQLFRAASLLANHPYHRGG